MSGIYIPNMKIPIGHNEATFDIDADGHPLLAVYTEKNTEPEIYYIIPAADVRPVVHGEWKLNELGEVRCSECGEIVLVIASDSEEFAKKQSKDFKYCFNCGADMREES